MDEEEKARQKLERARESKRKWWHSEKGRAWRDARKAKEAGLDARKDPTQPEQQ